MCYLAKELLATVALPAGAAPIYQIGGGSLAITGVFSGSDPTVLDVRGAVLLQVSDTGLPLSPLAVYDSTGGTDPGAITLPFGNSTLFADDGTPGFNALVIMDFAQTVTIGTRLVIPGFVTLLQPGTPPGALSTFAGDSPVFFGFENSAFADLGDGNYILQWQLTDISADVPEPATVALLPAGFLLIGMLSSRRRKNDLLKYVRRLLPQ